MISLFQINPDVGRALPEMHLRFSWRHSSRIVSCFSGSKILINDVKAVMLKVVDSAFNKYTNVLCLGFYFAFCVIEPDRTELSLITSSFLLKNCFGLSYAETGM